MHGHYYTQGGSDSSERCMSCTSNRVSLAREWMHEYSAARATGPTRSQCLCVSYAHLHRLSTDGACSHMDATQASCSLAMRWNETVSKIMWLCVCTATALCDWVSSKTYYQEATSTSGTSWAQPDNHRYSWTSCIILDCTSSSCAGARNNAQCKSHSCVCAWCTHSSLLSRMLQAMRDMHYL
jgi:hypothetical protein